MYTVLLPPGGNPIAVKYILYHIIYHEVRHKHYETVLGGETRCHYEIYWEVTHWAIMKLY
jgi:hypothetical protein